MSTISMTTLLQEASNPDLRDPETWARSFVQADGDESKAKALYVKAKMPISAHSPVQPSSIDGWCPNCSNSCKFDAKTCQKCGAHFVAGGWQVSADKPKTQTTASPTQQLIKSTKSRGIYIILGLFLGCFGIHNFYAARYGIGAAQLIITLLLGWILVGFFITALWALVELLTVKSDGAGDPMT